MGVSSAPAPQRGGKDGGSGHPLYITSPDLLLIFSRSSPDLSDPPCVHPLGSSFGAVPDSPCSISVHECSVSVHYTVRTICPDNPDTLSALGLDTSGHVVRLVRTICPPRSLSPPSWCSWCSEMASPTTAVTAIRPLLHGCYTVATRRYGIATRLLHCVSIWFLVFAGYEEVAGGNPGSKSDSDLNRADSRWPDPERPDPDRPRS